MQISYLLTRYEKPRRKKIINCSCPEHHKIITEVKIHINVYFHTFCGAPLRHEKEV